jgi:hypothetical protein
LKDIGRLDLFAQKVNDPLWQEIMTALFSQLDETRARALASLVPTETAFQKLAPHLQGAIAKWPIEHRRPFFALPFGLDPDMPDTGHHQTKERITNFQKLQDEIRARYRPITSTNQGRYIDEFKFKYITISTKASRRYWDSFKMIPWKAL